jgi:3-phosphoshikimate 1-carboxyvinyltransferase
MNLKLKYSIIKDSTKIIITGSKSETNRLLLLQALFPEINLKNTSNSDDSEVMMKALCQTSALTTSNPKPTTVDVHHAGTAMRFLTAYFAIQPNSNLILTGSSRMKERPIHILVKALNDLGAEISYQEKVGFPPIKIKGKEVEKSEVSIEANTSSQFISALLLIAPKLKNGLKLNLKGEITSLPYIQMTLALLNKIGIETFFENSTITIKPINDNLQPTTISIESDWSSASYFYSLAALSEVGTQLTLSNYKNNSLQGDAILSEIYKDFGVETVFNENESITISKINFVDNSNDNFKKNLLPRTYKRQPSYNLNNCPDIAQTIAVTCFGLGIGCELTGLHTLKIKETDRLEALKTELSKLGAAISVTANSLVLEASISKSQFAQNISIATYQDHRMAMAFAPLALKTSLIIQDAEVVSKSYPSFWEDLESCGISIERNFQH